MLCILFVICKSWAEDSSHMNRISFSAQEYAIFALDEARFIIACMTVQHATTSSIRHNCDVSLCAILYNLDYKVTRCDLYHLSSYCCLYAVGN